MQEMKEMKETQHALYAREVFAEDGIQKEACVLLRGGKILEIVPYREAKVRGVQVEEAGARLLPGFFDTHIHGALGVDTMDATPEALDTIGGYLASCGTTSYMPTTVTDRWEKILSALRNLAAYQPKEGAAIPRGSFVEGPYLTEEHRGAHPAELLRELSLDELSELMAAGPIRALAVAPEKQGAAEFIRTARAQGVRISIGHSSATYEEARAAVDAGADAAIHTYCGMSPMHHRAPMLLGEAMTDDRLYAELIADGIHVSLPAMDILRRAKPKDKLILISDAISATGMPDGDYRLGKEHVALRGGIARTDSGALAGSTTNVLAEVRRLILALGEEPLAAVHMGSLNGARRYGLASVIGSIREGKCADLVAVDEEYKVLGTWLNGRKVSSV